MRSVRTMFVAITLSLLTAACSTNVRRSELVGTYILQMPETRVSLHLDGDGNFEQTIIRQNASPVRARGTWEWDSKLHALILNDAFEVSRSGTDLKANVIAMPVVKQPGSMSLEYDPNAGDAYRKQ